ncbi:hypothetical protein HNV12_10170 [Methanococcoides sp. SA1]|nr:hypothetical protein [Methanococcoides sp. SA1]
MLIRMMCKNMNGKQTIGIGQLTMVVGLGCNAAAIWLNRAESNVDFLQGFLAGFGVVMLLTSVFFNIKGMKMVKVEQK